MQHLCYCLQFFFNFTYIGGFIAIGLTLYIKKVKYVCPITVFLKPASYFSLMRVKVDQKKCVSCGKCKRICPMNVEVTDNSRKRENGTECILCFECVDECPKKTLRL